MFLINHEEALVVKKMNIFRRLFSVCILFTVQDILDLANSRHFGGGLSATSLSALCVS